ncbi:MAG: hypothetical protein ABH834_01130, partial [Candidatus Altiarchaeota archaeon]
MKQVQKTAGGGDIVQTRLSAVLRRREELQGEDMPDIEGDKVELVRGILANTRFHVALEREYVHRSVQKDPTGRNTDSLLSHARDAILACVGEDGVSKSEPAAMLIRAVDVIFGDDAPDAWRELCGMTAGISDKTEVIAGKPEVVGRGDWMYYIGQILDARFFIMLAGEENPLEALKNARAFGETLSLTHAKVGRKDEVKPLAVINHSLPMWRSGDSFRGVVPEGMRESFRVITHPRMAACMSMISEHGQISSLSDRLIQTISEQPGRVIGLLDSMEPAEFVSFMASDKWRSIRDVPAEDMNASVRLFIPGAKPCGLVEAASVSTTEPSSIEGSVAVFDFGKAGKVFAYKPVFDGIAGRINLGRVVGADGLRFLERLTQRRHAGESGLDIYPRGANLPIYEQWLAEDEANRMELVDSYIGSFRRHLITCRFPVQAGGPAMIHPKIEGDEAAHFSVTKKSFDFSARLCDEFGAQDAPMLRPVMFIELSEGEANMYGAKRFGKKRMAFFEYVDGRRVLEQFPNVPFSPDYLRLVSERSGKPVEEVIRDVIEVPFRVLGKAHKLNLNMGNDGHLGNYMLTPDARVLFVCDLDDARDLSAAIGKKTGDDEKAMDRDYQLLVRCFDTQLDTVFSRAGLKEGGYRELLGGVEQVYRDSRG